MRIIGHIDMDAFFAAIEERDNPRFKGKPLVIGADPRGGLGRGVVSTASYAARIYGIRSAMPITRAWRLSEQAKATGQEPCIFLPPDMRRYSESSHRIMVIIGGFVPVIEQVSVDEAYMDLSFTGSYAKAEQLAKRIKQKIKKEERLTASIGIAPNKLMAKIASDMNKPDGLKLIREAEAEEIIEPLSVRIIPGIGPKTEKLFNLRKIFLISDLKNFSKKELEDMLGKWGPELYERIRGRDESPLITEWEAKSVGEQETFQEDTLEPAYVMGRVRELCESVFKTFSESEFKTFRRLVLTVRFENFQTKSKSKTLKEPSSALKEFKMEILKLLLPFFDRRDNPHNKKIRLVGVRLEELK